MAEGLPGAGIPPADENAAYGQERLRIWLWLALGYAGIASLVLGPAVILLWLAIKIFPVLEGVPSAISVLAAAFHVIGTLRALRRSFAPPTVHEGQQLRPKDAPALFHLIDAVRLRVSGPALSSVVLSNRLNASISQHARIPLAGKTSHTMEIGLPLLCFLPPEQIGAVIAHEFGHLVGRHGLLTRRIHALRHCLTNLQHELSITSLSSFSLSRWTHLISCFGLHRFLCWYVPRLDARTFAVRRAGEYVADGISARWDGPQTAIQALYSLAIADAYLAAEFWPRVWRQARHSLTPIGDPFTQLALFTNPKGIAPAVATEWLYHALRPLSIDDDTHPALADRAKHLGADLNAATACQAHASALHLVLPAGLIHQATEKMDAQWLNAIESDWGDHHRHWQETLTQREVLHLRHATQRFSAHDWLALAENSRLLLEPSRQEELQHALELAPDDPNVLYAVGCAQRDQGQYEDAARSLERAMELNRHEELRCSRALTLLSLARGDAPATARHRYRADEAFKRRTLVAQELHAIHPDDTLEPHGLPLRQCRQLLEDIKPIRRFSLRVWLVRKISRSDNDLSRYAFVVVLRSGGWRRQVSRLTTGNGDLQRESYERLAQSLSVDLPTAPLWHFCYPDDLLPRRLSRDGMPALSDQS
ncbi:M48 family metalloprotease [Achromobacter sp. NCFB-sbj8-Ac1-l]|uniref:M48 family metalloprotease n=1 Tax=unclassified Achromobacter TaxID=2626865 RepID=UPI004046E4E4